MASHGNRTRRNIMKGVGLAFGLSLAGSATAARLAGPIRLVVPYPPGGFTDLTARYIGQRIQAESGQNVLVENRAGANGIMGVQAIASAKPDGLTFGVVIAAHVTNTLLHAKLPYDPQNDLQAVSLIGLSPLVAATRKDGPYPDVQTLLAYARKHPGKVTYGSSGIGSGVHLNMELLQAQTETRMTHVPYRGSALALTDLIGGQIDLFMDAASGLIKPGEEGRVQLVGVASDQRLPALPNTPTFAEQGVADFTGNTWAGVIAPAGVAPDVIERVSGWVAAATRHPATRGQLEEMGTIPVGSSPAEFAEFMASETVKWRKVIQHANVRMDS